VTAMLRRPDMPLPIDYKRHPPYQATLNWDGEGLSPGWKLYRVYDGDKVVREYWKPPQGDALRLVEMAEQERARVAEAAATALRNSRPRPKSKSSP
jgi:hypothetical protein